MCFLRASPRGPSEVEWVGITRDTTDSDLKQRREISKGTVRHEAAPPLRAALAGRVLILDGVEKAGESRGRRAPPMPWRSPMP